MPTIRSSTGSSGTAVSPSMYRVDSEVGPLRQVSCTDRGWSSNGSPPATRTACCSTTCCGCTARAGGARPLRRSAARPRRHRAPVRRPAAHDRRAARRQGAHPRRIFDDRIYGPLAIDALRNCFDAMDLDTLTDHLIGGITKREVLDRIPEPRSVAFHVLDPDDFVLRRCRTTSSPATRRAGSTAASRSTPCARRPACARPSHYEAIYRWHPLFADDAFASGPQGASRRARPPPKAATCSSSAAAPC